MLTGKSSIQIYEVNDPIQPIQSMEKVKQPPVSIARRRSSEKELVRNQMKLFD